MRKQKDSLDNNINPPKSFESFSDFQETKGKSKLKNKSNLTTQLIAKCTIGALFFVTGITLEIRELLVSIVIALAFIIWGVVTYKQGHNEIQQSEKRKNDIARKCPSCGASVKGNTCEYCGYVFYEGD